MTDLIDTTEMYLRTVFELEEEGIPVLRARIVDRLGHSGPTVSQTVARMERDGLLTVRPDRSIELSESGRLLATRVMRKHRLAERLLSDVIGLEYPYVHDEACRWEHVMSERVERKIVRLLDEVDVSPYGNPVPGLDELGLPPADTGEVRVSLMAEPVAARFVVDRIGEPLQLDHELLERMKDAGIVPGAEVGVTVAGDTVTLAGPAAEATLDREAASHLFGRRA
ncbi:metal-dependent transcriptional regulator [Mobilicoccus pelagius]|uniref:Iron-dependent repressor n=1 Tax=Mobilicoccus pelagius NBRC 104925 TaxID=1089455 RepID=H5UTB7_9MICO|nr:metal-dependent transcriptional regulator [Mobilicoccus pelagius]GAB48975.1 iron-dependent repressor [Mobilicoccus pelagius NBRC 104925]